MAILLAGGAGFIGSHAAVEFLNAGYDVIIADNFDDMCRDAWRWQQHYDGTEKHAR